MPTRKGSKKYLTTEMMWDMFEQYRAETKSSPFVVKDWVGGVGKEVERLKEKPLTWVGYENFVVATGIITMLNDYEANHGGRYDEFKGVISRIKNIIRQDQIEGGMAMIYNPSITQRLNNLVEKSEVKVDNIDITMKL